MAVVQASVTACHNTVVDAGVEGVADITAEVVA